MNEFLSFFEALTNLQKLGWVVLCMAFFWFVEGAFPAVALGYHKWKHAKVNLVLLVSTILINAIFGLVAAGVFIWVDAHQIGLLHLVELPLWLELVLGIMLLDFIAQFGVHYLLHKYGVLWRFHMVHHSDTQLDVTSGTRHHPGDYIFREVFSLIAVVIGGLPFAFYLVYRIITVLFTYWTHANIDLPTGLDKLLSYVIVTPRMHKFHHHFERPWTDSNFGNILSIWDRLFGTYVNADVSKVQYGLDVLDASRSEDLAYQLKVPFDKTIKVGE
jgi:sterol desaturase/sphingolipid hydroxylase (fatty acid hydroxylase superfamily)